MSRYLASTSVTAGTLSHALLPAFEGLCGSSGSVLGLEDGDMLFGA